MATIPAPYNVRRVSVGTNRVDLPSEQAEMAVADALVTATQEFARLSLQHQEKQDRVAYSRATSALLEEDIRIRRELEEQGNWQTYSDDYRTRINSAIERIRPMIRDRDDLAVWDADSRVSVERGISAMSEKALRREIDEDTAALLDSIETLKDQMHDMDPATLNRALLNINERINARVDRGWMDPVAGANLRAATVEDMVSAQLLMMPEEEALAALQDSMDADPDRENLMNEGTGSIADFLPDHEKMALYKRIEATYKIRRDREDATNAVNEAHRLFPDPNDARERDRYIRGLGLNPEALEIATTEARQRDADVVRFQETDHRETMDELAIMIRDGVTDPATGEVRTFTYDTLPEDRLASLPVAMQDTLKKYWRQLEEGRQFAEFTVWHNEDDAVASWWDWNQMSDQQKAAENLNSPKWLTTMDGDTWRSMVQEQELIQSGGRTTALPGGATNQQLVDYFLVSTERIPQTGRSDEDAQLRAQAQWRFDMAVQQAQDAKGAPLTNQERRAVLAQTFGLEARVQEGLIGSWWDAAWRDPSVAFIDMSREQALRAYLPLGQARADRYDANQSYFEFLTARGQAIGVQGIIPDERMQRAYFRLKAGMSDQDVDAALRGD